MEFLSNKPLLITDTILRDAHQSQAATRMTIEDMLPALEQLDSIGYYSLECWGGATFDACMRFLNEDPWERLRTIRKHVKNTKLQMLFRGQNILGYKHYADDVVDAFCAKSIENGIDIIRIFDALNDVRNLEQAIKSTKKYGGQVEATLSYTISPIHNEAYFVKLAKELEDIKAKVAASKVASLFDNAEVVDGVKIASAYFTGTTGDTLRGMCDTIRDNAKAAAVAVLVGKADEKITMAVTVNKLAQEKGLKAGVLVKEISAIAGGKGGGKPDFAMAGLKDETKIDEALAAVKGIVEKQLG